MNPTIRNSLIITACLWVLMFLTYKLGYISGSSEQRKYDMHHIAELIMELEKEIMKDSSYSSKSIYTEPNNEEVK